MKLLPFVTLLAIVIQEVSSLALEAPSATPAPIAKRAKEVIFNKDYLKAHASTAEVEPIKPWIRTLTVASSTKVEIVTPTVIAGVTFGAKPPKTTNGLEKWVSLNKDGSPKTIKPQNKNGNIKNGYPTYGTWFGTFTTVTWSKEQLKADNMADDAVHEEEIHIEEDKSQHDLSPLLRCTPDDYKNKGIARDQSSEPFCYPRDNSILKMDKTYFLTWYSGFFDSTVEKVKIHLSYVKESARQKGLRKRSEEEIVGEETFGEDQILENDFAKKSEIMDKNESKLIKKSVVMDKGGKLAETSFFSTEWLTNTKGFESLYIDEEWLGEEYYKKVMISIQPDNVDIEDFDFQKNSIVVQIAKGAKVGKGSMLDLKKLEEKYAKQNMELEVIEGIDFEKYAIMLTMPLMVAVAALLMYFFVMVNKRALDFSHLRKKKYARNKTTHKMISQRGNTLPQFNEDIELAKND